MIRITESGQDVLRYCQLNQFAESELLDKLKDSKDELAGVIRIGGFSSVNRSLLIPSLKKMMIENPRLCLQLLTKEISELSSLLKSGEADYILTNEKSASPDIESIFLGYEDNVLVKSKKTPEVEVFLDHDENDFITKSYFSQTKQSFKPTNMRYLDDVYGLIDGVKNGYGKAILPLHLIKNEPSLEIIHANRVFRVSVYLQFFIQPFYRKAHELLIREITNYFKENLRPKN